MKRFAVILDKFLYNPVNIVSFIPDVFPEVSVKLHDNFLKRL